MYLLIYCIVCTLYTIVLTKGYQKYKYKVLNEISTLRLHIFVFFRYLGKSGLRVSCVGLGKCYNIRMFFFTAFDQSHCNMFPSNVFIG